jgi:hypothetical protein
MTGPPAIKKIVIEPMTERTPMRVLAAPIDLDEELPTSRPAWRMLAVMLLALVTAAVLDSHALDRSATGRDYGTVRDVERSVTGPLDHAAHAAGVDEPRSLADDALGRGTSEGSGPGLAQVKPSPVPVVLPTTVASAPAAPQLTLRTIDPAHPLKLWITGDSDIDYLGTSLLDAAAPTHDVRSVGNVDVHIGTGLVRPDVFDWLKYARTQSPKRDADAVVVTLGGNDAQGINIGPGKAVQPGDPRWRALYAQRIILVAQELSLHGRRPVYWVTLPPARDSATNHAFFEIDGALRFAATQVPGLRLLDAVPILSDHDRYSAYLPDAAGHKVKVRQSDGIHATFIGSDWLARALLAQLRADWKF